MSNEIRETSSSIPRCGAYPLDHKTLIKVGGFALGMLLLSAGLGIFLGNNPGIIAYAIGGAGGLAVLSVTIWSLIDACRQHSRQIAERAETCKKKLPATLEEGGVQKPKEQSPKATPEREALKEKLKEINAKIGEKSEKIKAMADAYVSIFHPLPFSKYPRQYPLMGYGCTVCHKPLREADLFKEEERKDLYAHLYSPEGYYHRLASNHGQVLSYKDDEIVEILTTKDIHLDDSPYFKGLTLDGRYIIQQNGIRGCVPAAAIMIISDRLGRFIEPEHANLADDDCIKRIIAEHNLSVRQSTVGAFDELQSALQQHGPACISVVTVGGHEIVIDGVTEKGVQIRDPYHGWAVVVTKDAFLKSTPFPISLIQAV